jgi:hypothetical protein
MLCAMLAQVTNIAQWQYELVLVWTGIASFHLGGVFQLKRGENIERRSKQR